MHCVVFYVQCFVLPKYAIIFIVIPLAAVYTVEFQKRGLPHVHVM
jgi:inner membrane protein involved in colicin E2 resistance